MAIKKKKASKSSAKASGIGITPLHDRVVIKPFSREEIEKKSVSGIIIPDTVSKEKPEQGIVVAVGPGKYDEDTLVPMTVKVGDKVMFSRYGFEEIQLENAEYYIISESNILAIIK